MCVLQTLLLCVIALPAVASAPCPRPCSCPQPTELHCTFRSLITIPPAAPKYVERMNLGFNSINKITDTSLAGMKKLELLMVHGNDIHSLPDGVFRDLTSLQMLKISYNKLKEIRRHTLQGLWSLARLHLDHNRLEFIDPDAFHGLTSLRLVQLEGNYLQQLHPATFTTFTLMENLHVSTLRHLYLSDNLLTSLPSRLVANMPQLENLHLHGNPWTCDCNMMWLQDWDKTTPGVLKCKKDRALPSGQLCPVCSSPRHLKQKELQAVESLVCSGPIISVPHKTSTPEDFESEMMATEDFREPSGNISLSLTDEHGNEVALDCSIGDPRELSKIKWEQAGQHQLISNVTLAADLECPVDREKYEQLWRLIAYYSNVPAHLQRDMLVSEEPHPTYVYKQDSERDALYFTGVKVTIMSEATWLMQTSLDLQLNRLQSSGNTVKLILSTYITKMVDVELVQRQRRSWVMIQSTNTTHKVYTAILGNPSQMHCSIQSSEEPVVHWMLPDGSKLEAPYSSGDNSLSVSTEGTLFIQSVNHKDTGIYYCIAKVHGDLAVMSFHLTVQESSNPTPGEDGALTPIEGFSGAPISLSCSASGSPDAEINWILPSKNVVSFQANSSRALVFSNGTLHIPQMQLTDSGYYKCIAINQHGVDTLVTKVNIVRGKGLIRPFASRRFPAKPQSASGINTKIKVPADDAEGASGDVEVSQEEPPKSRTEPLRRRVPGGAGSGRRGLHPSRGTWQRPPLLRKPTGSHADGKKDALENRRRINMSNSKVDPEKWADILAKFRDRNVQNAVTEIPAQRNTERKLSEQTAQSQDSAGGTSDSVITQEKEGRYNLITTLAPIQHTQMETNGESTQGQGTQMTSDSLNTQNMHDVTSDSQYTFDMIVTTKPQATEHLYNLQPSTLDMNLEQDTPPQSTPQLTTSVPLHTTPLWRVSANTAPSGASVSLNSTNADVEGVKTDDWSKTLGRSKNVDRVNIAASSDNDREIPPSIPSVHPDKSDTSHRENGRYVSETATPFQPHAQLNTATLDDLLSRAMLTTASQTTTVLPTTSQLGQSPRLHQQRNPRRRNGNQRRRLNRRKQKLDKPTHFITATPANTPLATVPSSPSRLKIKLLEDTTANFQATVLFTSSQAASSGRVSHKESTVWRHGDEAASKSSSLPDSLQKTKYSILPLAKTLSTSAAPSFPAASPDTVQEEMSSQTISAVSESVSPTENLDMSTSVNQMFTDIPSAKPSEDTPRPSTDAEFESVPPPEKSPESILTAVPVQTDAKGSQSPYRDLPTENAGEITSSTFVLPYPTPSAASWFVREAEATTGTYSSSSPIATTVLFEDVLEAGEPASTPTGPDRYHSRLPIISSQSEGNQLAKTTAKINVKVDATITSSISTAPASTTSFRLDAEVQSHVTPNASPPQSSDTDAKLVYSQQATTKEAAWFSSVSVNQSQQIHSTPTTQHWRTTDLLTNTQLHGRESAMLTTAAPPFLDLTLTNAPPINHGTKSTSQPHKWGAGLPTANQDPSRKHQSPARGSVLRGKPNIIKNTIPNFTVKGESDAQLPCEAVGEPRPFLSWTKVVSGASIAQNTRVQRFEVHMNGTLTIRNTQPVDGGQYLCTVQNQYGTDQMAVNLVVLPPQPQPRDVTVRHGSSVDLKCDAQGHSMPRFTWVLPNHAHMSTSLLSFPPQQRAAVLSNGTLRISQASYGDSGIYKCIVGSATGTDSTSIRLHVLPSPPVLLQPLQENKTVMEGSAVYIHCSSMGSPPPVIQWITPDGVTLTTSQHVVGRNIGVFPNGTLYVRKLGAGNSGRYQCTASNVGASSSRTVVLNMLRNPSSAKAIITSSSPQKTDVIYGGMLLLNCVAKGQPEPRILWRTPSKKLVDAQYSFDPRIKVYPNGTITVHSVTNKDTGDYLCVARNKIGDDYVLLGVDVLTRPAKIEQKQQRSSQEVVYGGDLKVDCVASGLPNPEISWALPDGTMVNPVKQREGVSGGRSRRYVVFDNGTLYFNDVGMREEGDYTCYAENQLGKDEMKVRVKIKVSALPPRIQDAGQRTVKALYGETASLTCNAKGDPMPVITWISPINKVISSSSDKYQILNDGTLLVQKVQRFDGGNYTCTARNSVGQDYKVIRLEVLVTPPMINGFRGAENVIRVFSGQDQRKLIDCVGKGTPTPRVMWVLPGNVVLPAPYYSNRMTVHLNGTLEIRSPKKSDSGQLVCIARNEGGEVKLVVNLDVKEVVERLQIRGPAPTNSLSLTVGNDMTLNCSFEGAVLPQVTWILPSGIPLLRGSRSSKFFHHLNGSLTISNPSVAEAGMYRCVRYHPGGVMERMITLSPGRKPEILNQYNTPLSIMNGETLLVHCLTSAEPLRLTWTLPSGVVLNRPQRAGRYAVLANGTLAIQQVSVYDRGSYVCRATNEYGSSLLAMKVDVNAMPPRITNGPPSVTYAKRGVAVQLNCMATGVPRAEIAWETPDKTRLAISAQPRIFANKYLHPHGSLIIQNPTLRDAGVYRCTARNALGVDIRATFLNVF